MKGPEDDLAVRLNPAVPSARRPAQQTPDATGAVALLPPPVFGVCAEEWRALSTTRTNLLLVGDEASTSAFLRALLPTLQEPVWMTAAAPLSLPSSPTGTLLVRDGACLAPEDQKRLLQWLSNHPVGVQVVTTTPAPLVPLVLSGAFLEVLYYRLNVMYVELGIGNRS